MPELPEIESLRRSLACVIGGRVERSEVRRPDMLFPRGAKPLPVGCHVVALHRHGKQLVIESDRAGCLLVHLGMSGSLRLVRQDQVDAPDRHVHAAWNLRLQDGSPCRLLHRDPRRFGWLEMFPRLEEVRRRWLHDLGPDALEVSAPHLERCLARTDRMVKAVLLDQHVVAGVGNIYADESLFRAGIHPFRKARGLGPHEISRLAAAIRSVLRKAVELGGSTIRDHRTLDGRWGSFQRLHRVYGRGGLPCRSCGTVLVTRRLQQRATVLCPVCQPSRPAATSARQKPS